jgi:hypothetical protein
LEQTEPKMSSEPRSTEPFLSRLQPVMIAIPVLLIGIFTVVSYLQVSDLNERITSSETMDLHTLWQKQPEDSVLTGSDYMNLQRWRALTAMENMAMTKRYQQGGLLIITRIFTKYLGFLTGMIMAIAGAVFIIGRIKEDQSDLAIGTGDKTASLKSSSPGIIFGVLGTALMGMTIMQHTDIGIIDRPLYLHPLNTYLTSGQGQGGGLDIASMLQQEMSGGTGSEEGAGGPSNDMQSNPVAPAGHVAPSNMVDPNKVVDP